MRNFEHNMNVPEYFKTNYSDVVEIHVPKFYLAEDRALSGVQVSLLDKIINSHISLAANFTSVFPVSATTGGSSLGTFSGAAFHFIKQNNPLNLTTFNFESQLFSLIPKSLASFTTSSGFSEYVSGTLLPGLRLNSPTFLLKKSNFTAAHNYLIDTIGWLYFLNLPVDTNRVYEPSSYVHDLLVQKTFNGDTITLLDGIKGATTFIWKNWGVCSVFQDLALIPSEFLSGTGAYVSGTQQLDKLLTLIEVVYSDLVSDQKDVRVQEAFQDYTDVGVFQQNLEAKGPLSRYLKGISYSIYDVNDEINILNLIYDIDNCPQDYLPYIAELIGWRLLGFDKDRWRSQLRNAVNVYKAKGTKRALQIIMDATFGDGSYDLESKISELYESYIPNLIYYALATEAPIFSSFNSWTKDLATTLGIDDYSYVSMDTNIRFVVDDIIRDAAIRFPDLFFVGNKPFDLDDPKFVFNYRGRIINIPPWEMEKYYRYCNVTDNLLEYLHDRLVCLGVSRSFADSWLNYISENTVESTRHRNNWLFFTDELQYAPNYFDIVVDLKKSKIDYLPIWSGKSSHFDLILAASSFNFSKFQIGPDSLTGLKVLGDIVKEYTPAHAIPNIDLELDSVDEAKYLDRGCMDATYPQDDLPSASSVMQGYGVSGYNMSAGSGVFLRAEVDSISDPLLSSVTPINVPRNSLRRKNLIHLIPKDGWYDRTGFNMPKYQETSSTRANSTYLPLGYIPSANKFQAISSIDDIPAVYDICNDYNSSASYYGVNVSSTFPCRGASAFVASECYSYALRSDCHEIIPVIHNQIETRRYADVSSLVLDPTVYSSLITASSWVDHVTASANAYSELSSILPFFNFSFGRGVQEVYENYVRNFSGHDLSDDVLDASGGPDVISHTYGPLVYNGYFATEGSAATTYPIVTSSFLDPIKINNNNGAGIMSSGATASGTYVASSTSSMYIGNYEYRNSHIISGVELIDFSGASQFNEFIFYNTDEIFERESQQGYAVGNPMVRLKNADGYGLQRIKFNFSYSDNLLVPEHKFEVNVKTFVGREGELAIGGGTIGVWIHTEPEDGYYWSYDKNHNWVINAVSAITVDKVLTSLSHTFQYPFQELSVSSLEQSDVPCINEVLINEVVNPIGMENLSNDLFKTFKVEFNTWNHPICVPNYYNNIQQQVHRLNQTYSIEVFMLPDTSKKVYTIIDEVVARDNTMYEGVELYTPIDLLKCLRFFTDLASDRASRVATITSSVFDTSGGSRLNYQYNPEWGSYTKVGNNAFTRIDMTR